MPQLTQRTRTGTFIAFSILIALAICILDTQFPLGVADGVLYVALVLIGLLARDHRLILGGAIAGTILGIFGFFISPPGAELWMVIVNRGLSIFVIWMTAYLCLWQQRSEKKIQEAHDKLDLRVKERTAELNETNRKLDREKQFVLLHKEIAVAANESCPMEETMALCLQHICNHAGWPVGHLYLPADRDSCLLVPTTIWYLEDDTRFSTFRIISEATPLEPGVGLPGRVMVSGKPEWIIDVTQDPNFPRARLAENIGVKAGFAFPLLIEKKVGGIMEFFSSKSAEPDGEMLEVMAQVGTQLGRVIERRHAQEDEEKLLRSLRERVKELSCMYQTAHLVNTSKTMNEVFQKLDSIIVPSFQYPEITRVRITSNGETFLSNDFHESSWKLSETIRVRGKSRGQLEIFYIEDQPILDEGPFLREERQLLQGLVHLLGVASEHKEAEEEVLRSREQLRNLYHRLELVREDERTHIAREVHDELAQVLTTLKLELSLMVKKLGPEPPGLQYQAQLLLELIDNTIQTVKKIVMDLRPPILDELGLNEAIEWQGKEFEEKTGIACELDLEEDLEHLTPKCATTVFRIFQETLTNVVRHAKASKINIELTRKDGMLVLCLKDDGIGVSEDQIENPRSLGILGMRERAIELGGQFQIEGTQGKGTVVTIRIPEGLHDHSNPD